MGERDGGRPEERQMNWEREGDLEKEGNWERERDQEIDSSEG